MGSLKGQKTAGRYIDGYLHENLSILADAIVKDNTFLGFVSSSTLEVGTGKSCFVQQLGEAWTELINKKHNQNLEFNMRNVVFKPEHLIERAFKLPKYSCIILDEWDDATYWSQLGISLRQFFRKCRQLNLFMICICPNFFQIPLGYSVSRSVFFIDVKFADNFERGHFEFYSFKKKKDLYLKGKKNHDYNVTKSDFYGVFSDGYAVPEQEYRSAKLRDLAESEKPKITERSITINLFKQFKKNRPDISVETIASGFGITKRTGFRWLVDDFSEENEGVSDGNA